MTKIGSVFKFAAPANWTQFQDGARHVFHGPNWEELIVSASFTQGIGTTADLTTIQQQLFEIAKKSMTSTASNPDLRATQLFAHEPRATKVECWTLLSQTQAGDILFYQALFRDPRGVLLATLEAPNTSISKSVFVQFIQSVETVSESDAFSA